MDWEGEHAVKRKLKSVGCADTIHSKAICGTLIVGTFPLLGQNRLKCLNQEHCDDWRSQKLKRPGIELLTSGTGYLDVMNAALFFLPCENRCRVFLPSFVKSPTLNLLFLYTLETL